MGELQNPSFGSQKATQKEQRSACNALRASCTSVFGDLPGSRPERVGEGARLGVVAAKPKENKR